MKIRQLFYFLSLLLSTLLVFILSGMTHSFASTAHLDSSNWIEQQVKLIKSQTNNIDSKVLRLGLLAYSKAKQRGVSQKPLLTVIDFSKPSTKRRLWVFDLKNGKTLFNTWVSHGKNSGGVQAESFSNRHGSLKSSIGLFVTGGTYSGKNGYSLHLRGLERGINDNAYDRSIVIHGARYVNPDIINKYGHIGRSWGCPAVSVSLAKPFINAVKDKTILFAYYPDRNWLHTSKFLT